MPPERSRPRRGGDGPGASGRQPGVTATRNVRVVGVGASAGGLDAIRSFCRALPPEPGPAFVIVQHTHPKAPVRLPELLGRVTDLPIVPIEDGMPLRASCIFVAPGHTIVSLEDVILRLREPEEGETTYPIDAFFRSLATSRGERATAIVLSGTGSDGTQGLRAVAAEGGLVLVQAPETAGHDGMPRSALSTDVVHAVLPPDEMPATLLDYDRHFEEVAERPSENASLRRILARLRARTGHELGVYKRPTVERRLRRRMGLRRAPTLEAYLDILSQDDEEVAALHRDLLVNVTGFFRDREAWDVLQHEVIRPLVRDGDDDRPLRAWVPGTATGEEAYSLAILLREELEAVESSRPLQIFASDVNEQSLRFARAGIYPESIVHRVPRDRLRHHFERIEGDGPHYRVAKVLRESVVFASQDVIADPPFSNLDVVCCRNLLIYIQPEIQRKILSLFHFALRPGGFLFLGAAEGIDGLRDRFEAVSSKWRIYRRIGSARRDRAEFPILPVASSRREVPASAPRRPAEDEDRLPRLVERTLLERFAPASVLVSSSYEILYVSGAVDAVLALPGGEPTRSLLDLARRGLRSRLRGALHRAARDGESATAEDVQVERDGARRGVDVSVIPVESRNERLLLVTFQPRAEPATPAEAGAEAPDAESVRHLEEELRRTRDELHSSIEQLESSNEDYQSALEEVSSTNEELQSANEELQSSNEELETSREELQSLNEELDTVNRQLQEKVVELERSRDDLENLMKSTRMPTLCLDLELRIQWHTPAIRELFPMLPGDAGRRISDLASGGVRADLVADAETVLRELGRMQREVTEEGRWYRRDVVPYRTAGDRIEGVVVTFTEVTDLKAREQQIRMDRDRRGAMVSLLQEVAIIANEATSVRSALRAALERIGAANGWQVGHAYLADERGRRGIFADAGVWYLEDPERHRGFADRVGGLRFAEDEALVGRVAREGEEIRVRELADSAAPEPLRRAAAEAGLRSAFLFPLLVGREVAGVMEFFAAARWEADAPVGTIMAEVGAQLGRVIERRRFAEEITQLGDRVQRRFSQDLHDRVGQQMAGIAMTVQRLRRDVEAGAASLETVNRVAAALDEAMRHVRALARGLMPVDAEAEGLRSALENLVRRFDDFTEMRFVFECEDPVPILSDTTATHLFRIAQEAMQNARQHSGCRNVVVRLSNGERIVLEVRDDGRGGADRSQSSGVGQRIMRHRAEIIGAELEIESGPRGSSVRCILDPTLRID